MKRKIKMKLCLYMNANKFLTGINKNKASSKNLLLTYKTTTLSDVIT